MAGVRHFTELDCWQLAEELKQAVYTVLNRPVVCRDFRFCNQLRDAAASAPRNIAEGFGRKTHRDFAHFLDIARASLNECQNHLNDGVHRGHITPAECRAMTILAKRAAGATASLQRYLRTHPDP